MKRDPNTDAPNFFSFSTTMFRCVSPIPLITVCPVLGSRRNRNAGSSAATLCNAGPSLSSSTFVFARIAIS